MDRTPPRRHDSPSLDRPKLRPSRAGRVRVEPLEGRQLLSTLTLSGPAADQTLTYQSSKNLFTTPNVLTVRLTDDAGVPMLHFVDPSDPFPVSGSTATIDDKPVLASSVKHIVIGLGNQGVVYVDSIGNPVQVPTASDYPVATASQQSVTFEAPASKTWDYGKFASLAIDHYAYGVWTTQLAAGNYPSSVMIDSTDVTKQTDAKMGLSRSDSTRFVVPTFDPRFSVGTPGHDFDFFANPGDKPSLNPLISSGGIMATNQVVYEGAQGTTKLLTPTGNVQVYETVYDPTGQPSGTSDLKAHPLSPDTLPALTGVGLHTFLFRYSPDANSPFAAHDVIKQVAVIDPKAKKVVPALTLSTGSNPTIAYGDPIPVSWTLEGSYATPGSAAHESFQGSMSYNLVGDTTTIGTSPVSESKPGADRYAFSTSVNPSVVPALGPHRLQAIYTDDNTLVFANSQSTAATSDFTVGQASLSLTVNPLPDVVSGQKVSITGTVGWNNGNAFFAKGGGTIHFITPAGDPPLKDIAIPYYGFDLRLMSWGNGTAVPTSGSNLVVVGTDNNNLLHIRTFDANGYYSDTNEGYLSTAKAAAVATLKQQLPGLLLPHVLTDAEKAQVTAEALSLLGRASPKTWSFKADPFTPVAGHKYQVQFIPNDTTDYKVGQPVDVTLGKIGLPAVTTTLVVPASAPFGQAATLSAVVDGSTVPPGHIQFFADGGANPIGTVAVNGPGATGTVGATPPGNAHTITITAKYILDNPSDAAAYAMNTIAPATLVVTAAPVDIAADPIPSVGIGQKASITAHLGAALSPTASATLARTGGMIHFLDETNSPAAPDVPYSAGKVDYTSAPFVPSAKHQYHVTFTPNDKIDFIPSSANVTVGAPTRALVSTNLVVPATAPYGQPVTVSAVLSGTGAGVPPGNLQLLVDGVAVPGGTVHVAGAGSFTFPTITLKADKTHAIGATFVPDVPGVADVAPITAQALTIQQAVVSTRLDPLPDAGFGKSVTARAHVSVVPDVPAGLFTGGTLVFLDEAGKPIGKPVNVTGPGDYSSDPFVPASSASHAVRATFTPNDRIDFAAAPSTTGSFSVTPVAVTTSLVVPPGASYGQPVQLSAIVGVSGGQFAGGWLQFVDQGKKPVGDKVRVTGPGMVSVSGVTLPAGSYQVSAVLTPDDPANTTVGPVAAQPFKVAKALVVTQIDRLPDAPLGQAVSAKAHLSVQPDSAAKGFAGGTLVFLDEAGKPIGKPVVVTGVGDYSSDSYVPAASASHAVRATFTPSDPADYTSDPAEATFSVGRASVQLRLTDASGSDLPVTVPVGQDVAFRAVVGGGLSAQAIKDGSPTPSRRVLLLAHGKDGSVTTLDAQPIHAGSVALMATAGKLPSDTLYLTASYEGDANFDAADSVNRLAINLADPTSFTIASAAPAALAGLVAPGTSLLGEPVTFTSTIKARSAQAGVPQGKVAFYAGDPDPSRGLLLGTGDLKADPADPLGAIATLTTAALAGDADVYAVYQPAAGSAFVPDAPFAKLRQSVVLGVSSGDDGPNAGKTPGTLRFAVAMANLGGPKRIEMLLPAGSAVQLTRPLVLHDGIILDGDGGGTRTPLVIDASAIQADPADTRPRDGTQGDETAVIWVDGHGITVRGLEIVAPGRPNRAAGSAQNLPVVAIKLGPGTPGGQVFGNLILGNRIGTDGRGGVSPNMIGGIEVANSFFNLIQGNTIAGLGRGAQAGTQGKTQGAVGIRLTGALASQNKVYANVVGTFDGQNALGKPSVGILVENAPVNEIGGTGLGNVVAGREAVHLLITGPISTGNHVSGNTLGSMTPPPGVVQDGIDVRLAGGNLIDGQNRILGYSRYGIYLTDAWTTENVVDGNIIGQDPATGPGGVAGVVVNNAPGNRVTGNQILDNATGVIVSGGQSHDNVFQDNSVRGFSGLPFDVLAGAPAGQFPTVGDHANKIVGHQVSLALATPTRTIGVGATATHGKKVKVPARARKASVVVRHAAQPSGTTGQA